jgi:transposase
MRKRTYRSIDVNKVDAAALAAQVGSRAVIGLDIAKSKQLAAVAKGVDEVVEVFHFVQPQETPAFFALCEGLRAEGVQVEVAMESTGTYGEAIRAGLQQRGFTVYLVAASKVHGSAEVFDGTPSHHDAKAAAQVAWLHLLGRSSEWKARGDDERQLRALTAALERREARMQGDHNRLEALMAAHWPELDRELKLNGAAVLSLLAEYGSPAAVTKHSVAAGKLLEKVGGPFLARATIDAVLQSAARTTGVPMLDEERQYVRTVARELLADRRMRDGERRQVERLCRTVAPEPLMRAVGVLTTGVLLCHSLDPRNYGCATEYEKALGLNLKENSSGKLQGRGVHITKRGSSKARKLLHLAALRLIMNEPIVRAWFTKKRERDGARAGTKGVVAVTRKLAKALWYVARGDEFDAAKLFDTRRLVVIPNKPRAPRTKALAA